MRRPPMLRAASRNRPATLTIGGVTLAFAPPSGTCLYPAPLLEAVRVQQGKLNPDNAIDMAFADCNQLRDNVANQSRIRDFGLLMTPKVDLNQRVDRAMIDQIAGAMPDQTSVKATLDQRLVGAESKLALQSFSALGVDRPRPAGNLFGLSVQSPKRRWHFYPGLRHGDDGD